MNGILNVLKPPGMTSHDVVKYIRRMFPSSKVGHTGTLDKGAAGVLPVCIGQATRIIRFLESDKNYRVEITFGTETTTGDNFGAILSQRDASNLPVKAVENLLEQFKGEIKQVPPMISAIRHQGERLYQLARKGQVVERVPRRVIIYSIQISRILEWGIPQPRAFLDISCSAGTYMRSLCADLGYLLGYGAHMSFLLRTRAGIFSLDQARTLEELSGLHRNGRAKEILVGMDDALTHLPPVQVKKNAVSSVQAGRRLYFEGLVADPGLLEYGQLVRLKGPKGLLAIARVERSALRPFFQPVTVFPTTND